MKSGIHLIASLGDMLKDSMLFPLSVSKPLSGIITENTAESTSRNVDLPRGSGSNTCSQLGSLAAKLVTATPEEGFSSSAPYRPWQAPSDRLVGRISSGRRDSLAAKSGTPFHQYHHDDHRWYSGRVSPYPRARTTAAMRDVTWSHVRLTNSHMLLRRLRPFTRLGQSAWSASAEAVDISPRR